MAIRPLEPLVTLAARIGLAHTVLLTLVRTHLGVTGGARPPSITRASAVHTLAVLA